ncbi:MAG: YdcF family protein [Acidimicrobiales bacterium]|nr:YdcF family protein [Hyphomonadaceae bacterium]RZV42436.1 MAG: YdcF family protein [Acidimicrobiales bacterium]
MTASQRESKSPTKRQVFGALFKLSQFLISFAFFLILFGFIFFVFIISRAAPPDPVPKADGIVVLTGTGGGRLETGADLLKRDLGEQLLITGVNKSISADEIQSILQLSDEMFSCCVTLDYEAENTFENGKETANWAGALAYESILLVTSSYHMPRAQIEISTAMEGIRIIPYPVPLEQKIDTPWWGGAEKWKGLAREYGKLLVTYAREPGKRPKSKTPIPESEKTP